MMYQLLATVFVVSTFVSLILFAISSAFAKFGFAHFTYFSDRSTPRFLPYYIVHAILLGVYVPVCMSRVHGFSSRQILVLVILMLLPFIVAALGFLIVIGLVLLSGLGAS